MDIEGCNEPIISLFIYLAIFPECLKTQSIKLRNAAAASECQTFAGCSFFNVTICFFFFTMSFMTLNEESLGTKEAI